MCQNEELKTEAQAEAASHHKAVVESLELCLACPHHLGSRRDLQAQTSHALRLSNHDQDLGVEVDEELLGLWVTHQQGGLKTGLGCLNLSQLTQGKDRQGEVKKTFITSMFIVTSCRM